jgi:hypothetical protein
MLANSLQCVFCQPFLNTCHSCDQRRRAKDGLLHDKWNARHEALAHSDENQPDYQILRQSIA